MKKDEPLISQKSVRLVIVGRILKGIFSSVCVLCAHLVIGLLYLVLHETDATSPAFIPLIQSSAYAAESSVSRSSGDGDDGVGDPLDTAETRNLLLKVIIPVIKCRERHAEDQDAAANICSKPPVCLGPRQKIMPLGNSVTQADSSHASFRRDLWQLITGDDFLADFVGSLQGNRDGPNPYQDFDLDHEGHWGWRADEIAEQMPTWLTLNIPDIALIHLGGNDVLQNQTTSSTISDLENIVSILRTANPAITILIAQLIPLGNSKNQFIDELNLQIPALAASLDTDRSQVIVVDQNTGFSVAEHTYDGIHPNEAGEALMATVWYSVLKPILLSSCSG